MAIQNDILAKLLASENINIIRESARTASFNIVERTVSIPNWQDITPEIELMLIAHEVGHALFTPIELITDEGDSKHSYRNCIEDVRIERKIKATFPGLKKDFLSGYKQLNERNFFKINNKDLSKLNLIDRINIYFKCGVGSGVKFSPEEFVFVDRASKTDTYQDVLKLADDIYVFSKSEYDAKKEEKAERKKALEEEEEEEESYSDLDEESDDQESDDEESEEESEEEEEIDEEESAGEESDDEEESEEESESEKEDEALEAKTQDAFDDNLSELADTNTAFINYETNFTFPKEVMVGYKTVIADISFAKKENVYNYPFEDNSKKFKDDSLSCVNYLIKEFEMKKSASRYSRSVVAKSGSLNLNKLYAHSTSDNIFKQVTIVPDDKNHGMIFLLDWSGSMASVLDDTIKQVINLAMFCQRANIAYQVLAFTTRHFHKSSEPDANSLFAISFNLLEIFTNKMSTSEFNTMISLMLSRPWNYTGGYGLGSTPLNSSLMFMLDYIGKFKTSNNVEKVSLVTLTDGMSDNLSLRTPRKQQDYRIKKVYKLRDTKTKKDYTVSDEAIQQTQMLLTMIKDRYNIPVLGFMLTGITTRNLYSALLNLGYTNAEEIRELTPKVKSELRTGSYIVEHTAYDELYMLPANSKISEEELKADSNMTAAALSRNFSKFLNKKKTSRVVLDKFILNVA